MPTKSIVILGQNGKKIINLCEEDIGRDHVSERLLSGSPVKSLF